MEPEVSLLHSQVPATCPYPEPSPFSVAYVEPDYQSRPAAVVNIS